MPDNWICIDASLIIRLLIDTKDQRLPERWYGWHESGRQFAAPGLLFYEVANVLYQYQRAGHLTAEACNEALSAALTLPIQRYHELDLHKHALRLAGRFGLSATYDAHYLALADYLGAIFWTADRRLVTAVQPELTWVRLWE